MFPLEGLLHGVRPPKFGLSGTVPSIGGLTTYTFRTFPSSFKYRWEPEDVVEESIRASEAFSAGSLLSTPALYRGYFLYEFTGLSIHPTVGFSVSEYTYLEVIFGQRHLFNEGGIDLWLYPHSDDTVSFIVVPEVANAWELPRRAKGYIYPNDVTRSNHIISVAFKTRALYDASGRIMRLI